MNHYQHSVFQSLNITKSYLPCLYCTQIVISSLHGVPQTTKIVTLKSGAKPSLVALGGAWKHDKMNPLTTANGLFEGDSHCTITQTILRPAFSYLQGFSKIINKITLFCSQHALLGRVSRGNPYNCQPPNREFSPRRVANLKSFLGAVFVFLPKHGLRHAFGSSLVTINPRRTAPYLGKLSVGFTTLLHCYTRNLFIYDYLEW